MRNVKISLRYMKTSPPGHLPIFRSDEQARLLAEVFLKGAEGRSLANISRATGISEGGVHKEVERLERSGLVVSERVGRTRLVRPNALSPFFPHLRALLLKAFGPVDLLRRELASIGGIEEAFVFGSWAAAEAGELYRAPQDIDVMVIGEPDLDELYEVLRDVEDQIGRPVQPTVMSRAEWKADQTGFAQNIRSGPRVALVESDE